MTTRNIVKAQLSQAGASLARAQADLKCTADEPALFKPELIEAARNRVIELQHRYRRALDCYRAIFC